MLEPGNHASRSVLRLGAVSFLNTRPLVDGLDADPSVEMHYAVPAMLADLLERGEVDAALVPVIDWARRCDRWRRISDACIASDGETMTVRVFSRVPAGDIQRLAADPDSHTSVMLARILWRHRYHRPIEIVENGRDSDAVLLIGDKVVTARPVQFEFETDLGEAWKEWTGLPFVFAVWAAPRDLPNADAIAERLCAARDAGIRRAAEIARTEATPRGWPVELLETYLTQNLSFTLTPDMLSGMDRFVELAAIESAALTSENAAP